jgi:hypothetical protein
LREGAGGHHRHHVPSEVTVRKKKEKERKRKKKKEKTTEKKVGLNLKHKQAERERERERERVCVSVCLPYRVSRLVEMARAVRSASVSMLDWILLHRPEQLVRNQTAKSSTCARVCKSLSLSVLCVVCCARVCVCVCVGEGERDIERTDAAVRRLK